MGCRDITAGQIISQSMDSPHGKPPPGWLVDQWGRAHPLASSTLLGRDYQQCNVSVMHHSVSGRHARIDIDAPRQILLRDLGSLNGTYVNQNRVREARLRAGDRIALGEVNFYFATEMSHPRELRPGVGGTVPSKLGSLALAVRLKSNDHQAELRQRAGGGLIRTAHRSLDLAQLEFALLQALVEQSLAATDPDLCFMSTEGLLRGLDFRTLAPSGENLRELVRRLRRKLRQVGIDGLIESKRGVGYRLAWSVEPLDS